MSAVLRDWVRELPWKMQSVLIAGSRGPDSSAGTELKKFTRWIRQETQQNADPEHTYMQSDETPSIDMATLWREIEYGTTWHYFGHLLHALEVIAYKGAHLQQRVRGGHIILQRTKFAAYWYHALAARMHLNAESVEDMDRRLADQAEHD